MKILLNNFFFLVVSFFICLRLNAQTNNFKYSTIPTFLTIGNGFTKKKNISVGSAIYLERYLPRNKDKMGRVDYTDIVQDVINKNRIVIFPNFPILINKKGITIPSNTTIYFEEESKLLMQPNSLSSYELIRIHNVSNVKIFNAQIEGERNRHKGSTGEWGHGISIRAASSIVISNFKVSNFWGDGIYIGSLNSISSRKVSLAYGLVDNCRRNGISITSGIDVNLSNIVVANTNGTAPMYGIDIEPNSNLDNISNIVIRDYLSYNNSAGGIMVGINKLGLGKTKKDVNILVDGMKDYGSYRGAYFGNISSGAKSISGKIEINNLLLHENMQPIFIKSNESPLFKIYMRKINIVKPKNPNFNNKEVIRVMKTRKDVNFDL